MNSSQALRLLSEATASQWGLVTASQAASHGVSRLMLSRLTDAGHLERLAHGVYRAAAAPSDEFEPLRAAWLSTQPSELAEVRLRNRHDDVVVTGASAAHLHHIGDLPADRHEFSTPRRRQTQRPEIHYRTRRLSNEEITIAHGLPVTTKERTIADLVEARTDLSLVAGALTDVLRTGDLDPTRLQQLLAPLAARNNLPTGDGDTFLDHLLQLPASRGNLGQTLNRPTPQPNPGRTSASATTSLRELRQHTHDLVRRAEAGEQLVITISGDPTAVLCPLEQQHTWRQFNEIATTLQPTDDADWPTDRNLISQNWG